MGILKRIINLLLPNRETQKTQPIDETVAEYIGDVGERLTYKTLMKLCYQKSIFRNLYIKMQSNNYTEIDLIMTTSYGLFVIESKNLSGNIYGDNKYEQWIQYLRREKYMFYNPVRQNSNHIKHLKHILSDFPDLKYFSVIVFSERCNLNVNEIADENIIVIQRNQLYYEIIRLIENSDTYIDAETLSKVNNRLKSSTKTEEKRKQHLEYINTIVRY